MPENLVPLLTDILIAVAIGAAGYLLAWLIGRFLRRLLSRFLRPSWSGFLSSLAGLGIILLAIKLIVDQTGATGAFVVVVTALTGAFAIGSERLASDLVAGVKLLFLQYYSVGDLVTIAGHTGQVFEINMTNTIIATRRRDHVIIPNSQALGQIVINHSKIPGHIMSTPIPVAGEHDRDQVMQIMMDAAEAFTERMTEFNPVVLLDSFGVKTTYYKVGAIVDECTWKPSQTARLRLAVVKALEAAGITVGEAELIKIAK